MGFLGAWFVGFWFFGGWVRSHAKAIHTPVKYAPLSQVNSTGQGLRRFSQIKKQIKLNPQITQITQNEKDTSRPSTICRTYGVNKGAKTR